MKMVLGVLSILAGIAAFVYLEVAQVWIFGIEQLVRGFNAVPANGHDIAWGLVRVLGPGEVATVLIGGAIALPGILMVTSAAENRYNRRMRARVTNRRISRG